MTLNIPNIHVFRLISTRAKPGFCICDGSDATLGDSWQLLVTGQLGAYISVSAILLTVQKVAGTCFPGNFPELAGWAWSQVRACLAVTGLPVQTACKVIST